MDTTFFRALFINNENLANPPETVPEEFNEETPVVVLELDGHQAGMILGVSKVKGGNRMADTYLWCNNVDLCDSTL